jgi:opacity protein-like surface antigen
MRSVLAIIMILSGALLCAPTTGYSLVPRPYLGASLQINSPTGDFAAKEIRNKQGGAKTGIGGEIDLGITDSRWSAYAGFRVGQLNANTDTVALAQKTEKWTLNRVVIGLRWHILGGKPIPVVPTLGGGLTIGGSKADIKTYATGTPATVRETAKTSLGWFIEGGALVRLPWPISLIGDIQYHSFDSKFENLGTFKVAFVTIQAGIRYRF